MASAMPDLLVETVASSQRWAALKVPKALDPPFPISTEPLDAKCLSNATPPPLRGRWPPAYIPPPGTDYDAEYHRPVTGLPSPAEMYFGPAYRVRALVPLVRAMARSVKPAMACCSGRRTNALRTAADAARPSHDRVERDGVSTARVSSR